MKASRFLPAIFLIAQVWSVQASAEQLVAEEDLSQMTLRFSSGEARAYDLLGHGDGAEYLFCGQGRLQVRSRAVLPDGVRVARYRLGLSVDGADPALELSYRAYALEGALWDGTFESGRLKRSSINLPRGCHTVRLSLDEATVPEVGVRLSFTTREATKRAFRDSVLTGGRPVDLIARGERTAYRLLEAGQPATLAVEGPAWVRLLTRSAAYDEPSAFEVSVSEDGAPLRAYRLGSEPSRRAKLSGLPRLRVSAARELVFPVGPGRRELSLAAGPGAGVALRAQVATASVAARTPGEAKPSWSARGRLASYYDSNILRYSEKFIQRFEAGTDPRRFRVESLDDVVQRVDVNLDRDFTGLAGRPAQISLGLTHRAYARNDIKDWSRWQLSFSQDMQRGRRLGLFVNDATDFYVRHLRDGDLVGRGRTEDPFQAFEFRRSGAGLSYSHPVGASLDLRYLLGYARFEHSSAFREFDSDNLSASLRLDQQVSRRTRFSYAVEYTDSNARGYDEPGETLETSDDTDPAYRQLDFMVAARFRLPTERRQVIFLQAEVSQREYTTDKSISLAPLHAGREDDFLRLFGSWQIDLSPRYRLTVFAQSRDRSSSIPSGLDIGTEKDYDQYEAGLRISARFDL